MPTTQPAGLYAGALRPDELRALRRHTSNGLEQEIELLRALISREAAETQDLETITKAIDTLIRAHIANLRLATRRDNRVQLALQAALNTLDTNDAA